MCQAEFILLFHFVRQHTGRTCSSSASASDATLRGPHSQCVGVGHGYSLFYFLMLKYKHMICRISYQSFKFNSYVTLINVKSQDAGLGFFTSYCAYRHFRDFRFVGYSNCQIRHVGWGRFSAESAYCKVQSCSDLSAHAVRQRLNTGNVMQLV